MKDWFIYELGRLKPRALAYGAIIGALLLVAALWQWPDNNLHLVFCDVGQGDAILVFSGSTQLLMDGGPGEQVLGCLSRHMPFWDRTIEMVILTHPQADHLNGLISVLKRYSLRYFVSGSTVNTTGGYKELASLVAEKQSRGELVAQNVFTGTQISLGPIKGRIIWPKRDWVKENTTETATPQLNDYSLVLEIRRGNFRALLPGDADSHVDQEIIAIGGLSPVTVLKYPHHGSRTGATKEFLEAVSPKLAIISVGRRNSYGHPASETLELLKSLGIRYRRTDIDGDIEVVSDGRGWWVKTNKTNSTN